MNKLWTAVLLGLCVSLVCIDVVVTSRSEAGQSKQYEQWAQEDTEEFDRFEQDPVLHHIFFSTNVSGCRELSHYEIIPDYVELPDTVWVYAARGSDVVAVGGYVLVPDAPGIAP